MSRLRVNRSKLEKYIKQQGGYDLSDIADEVVLTFVPSFPEALEKGSGSPPPRVIMHGTQNGGIISFHKIEVEDERGLRAKEIREAELAYKSWLEFIDENC